MLFSILGISFLSGIGVFVLAFISNIAIGLVLEKVYTEIMTAKDNRMNPTTEAINSIKVLKLYTWTDLFQKKIVENREKELKALIKFYFYIVFCIASLYFFPSILSSVVFTTYIGMGNEISLADAFTVLVFFDLIKEPLRSFPMFFSTYI